LREPVAVGLKRANIVLTVGVPEAQARFSLGWRIPSGIIHLSGQLMPLATGMDWHDARVIAFAGIARPEKFFATLRDLGAEVLRGESLADHQPLPDALLRRLELEAYAKGAQLVTTEKDAARLPQAFLPKVLVLVVRLQIAELTQLDAALTKLGL
jgi:tetraacyldisaccharide 4'-kinase